MAESEGGGVDGGEGGGRKVGKSWSELDTGSGGM
jgi:hypothetical protein